jgi:hypothetical protein
MLNILGVSGSANCKNMAVYRFNTVVNWLFIALSMKLLNFSNDGYKIAEGILY